MKAIQTMSRNHLAMGGWGQAGESPECWQSEITTDESLIDWAAKSRRRRRSFFFHTSALLRGFTSSGSDGFALAGSLFSQSNRMVEQEAGLQALAGGQMQLLTVAKQSSIQPLDECRLISRIVRPSVPFVRFDD